MNAKPTSGVTLMDVPILLTRVRHELTAGNYSAAVTLATEIEAVLQVNESSLQKVAADVLLLLAQAHVTQAETAPQDSTPHIKKANELIGKAERMLEQGADTIDKDIALRAAIAAVEEGAEAGLLLLQGRADPFAIRTRTALLLNQQKYSDAMATVEGSAPHEWWCDVAVMAYALNDKVEKAQELVRWAAGLSDRSRYLQCCVRLAEGILGQVVQAHPKDVNILSQTLNAPEREKLVVAVEALGPILQPIQAARKPSSGLDMSALRIAWQANYLLQNREAAAEALKLMAQWTPVPLDVARGGMTGYIEAPADLPDRLRRDHPRDLDANILAAIIESASFGRHKVAFAQVKDLVPLADTDAKKEELFKLLQTLWQSLEGPEAAECETIAKPLVTHNPRLRTIFEASVALRRGDADTAVALLDGQKATDDLSWLQMRANVCLQKRQFADAVDFLLPAAEKTLDPGLLHKTGDFAFQAKRYDTAAWCYEKLVERQPNNLMVRGNLAHIYTFVLHDLEKAAGQFQALRALEPNNPTHTLNLAVCLAQLFRPEESLALYDELCRLENPPLPTVMGRAQLHHSMGHPDAALKAMDPFRSRFWGESTFLLAYMGTAYAAGREDAAHEALVALNEMQQAGAVKPEAFRAVPKDEALENFKQSFKQAKDRNEYLHAEMLKGRMPWVWADQVANNAIYWGWRIRTQKMDWIGDEPTNRARYCIYATNGFHARESERGRRELLPLECPPAGTRIITDISALITLHRLDLLDTVINHFGEMLVPAGYLPTVLEDSRRMVLNQRTQQQNAEQITKQINAGRVTVLAEHENPAAGMLVVDEYGETTEHRYRLTDVIQPLYAAGIVTDANLDRISRVSAKPTAVDDSHPALSRFQDVLVDLTTLETITNAGLLDAVASFYGLRITAAAHREVIQRLNAIACQEETRQWHMDLWKRLRDDPRFKFVPHTVPKAMRDKDSKERDYLPFLASFIAQETKTPLLVDDRACQAFTLNESADILCAAFGSDALVLRLMAEGKLDAGKTADALKQLLAWRYRFLVLPPAILKILADMHRGKPPGQALREVAGYVHDCMRDSGLFGGPEKTELGDSMAMRTYLTWVSSIAEFLVLVWADEGFAPEKATRLTTWACAELLPAPPRVVDGRMKVQIAEMTPRLFLSHALLKTANHSGEPRMADAMKAMKDGLRLTDDEYHRVVLEILNDTAGTAPQP
ncbi:MAG TPA: hypothetical protein P5567_00355 [Kiritimatiellia bacterium]|nr:hypothetical protein [Kiritimatiellia bacterium]HRZ10885.1 hypothetical protein [Kiritimatiellia bacterium]HSA18842.1 hypothetical protein [Kiritimatiellia bacterium]